MSPDETRLLSTIGVSILLPLSWFATISILQGMFIILFYISTTTSLQALLLASFLSLD
jgi:hypothetical protein